MPADCSIKTADIGIVANELIVFSPKSVDGASAFGDRTASRAQFGKCLFVWNRDIAGGAGIAKQACDRSEFP